MGGFLPEPIKTKTVHKGQNSQLSFCCSEMQGWRREMQDAAIFCLNIDNQNDSQNNKSSGNSLFAVFDGHGGDEVSKFLKQIFVKVLIDNQNYKKKQYELALRSSFEKIDQMLKSEKGIARLKQIRKQNSGQYIVQGQNIADKTGCTGNVILLTKDKIFVANAGDSRSALFRNGKTIELSKDHKPQNEQQLKRIQAAGGVVTMGRVNGGLNLSRSFGDLGYKKNKDLSFQKQMITCSPDIVQIDRNTSDQFILIGCDGIWQRYQTDSAGLMNKVKNMKTYQNGDLQKSLQMLLDELIAPTSKGEDLGLDNMTSILIKFTKS